MHDLEAMLIVILVLMIMPVVGALLYAALQWVLLQLQERRRQKSSRRLSCDQQDDSNDNDVSAVVQYAAHVCALLLLSGIVVRGVKHALTAWGVFDCNNWSVEVAVSTVVVLAAPLALGTLVVAVIRSPDFVQCGYTLCSVVRHRPPFSPESPSTPAAQRRWLSSSVVLSIVMFVHAGLEGVVLGLVFRRPVFIATFWSVALHNVAEGFVVAAAVFGYLRKSPQERHLSRRKVAESGEEDNRSLPRPHARASLLVAARHRWWRGVRESSIATLW